MKSQSSIDRFVAAEAIGYCLPTAMGLRNQVNASSNGELVRRIGEAQNTLFQRCARLSAVGMQELSSRKSSWQPNKNDSEMGQQDVQLGRGQTANEDFLRLQKNLTSMFTEFGPAALFWSSEGLGEWLKHARADPELAKGLDPVFASPNSIHLATQLAFCSLGYECGAESLAYLNICADGAQCEGSFYANILSAASNSGLTDSVTAQARVIAEAIAKRQLPRLGLR